MDIVDFDKCIEKDELTKELLLEPIKEKKIFIKRLSRIRKFFYTSPPRSKGDANDRFK